MEWLAKTVELASQQVRNDPEEDVFHGNVLWIGADGRVLLAHEECDSVYVVPPVVWVNFLLFIHPELAIGNNAA